VALVTLVARVLGVLARRFDQPAVLGELLGGILLGPTFFGGAIARNLFPADVRPFLSMLASIGVVYFMLGIGLELDPGFVRRRSRAVTGVAAGSMGVPLALGALLSLHLVDTHAARSRPAFCLFVAAAMSVTAFPVLARILTDRGMCRTNLGQMALACAAANDVVAYILIAAAVAVSRVSGSAWPILSLAPYVMLMAFVVRPLLRRLPIPRDGAGEFAGGLGAVGDAGYQSRMLALVSAGVLLSAAATNWMGMTAVFGAFFFGAIIPGQTRTAVRELVSGSIDRIGRVVLLPIFFVTAGLQVNLAKIGGGGVTELALILGVAILGKFGGAFIAARCVGMAARQSAAVATLMNTRGLTELIVLTVGLQIGVIDRSLYSLMVVMALITTAMTGPLLRLIYTAHELERDRYEAPAITEPAYL
jgi:Kef-type K+ transport system membrane component KefB